MEQLYCVTKRKLLLLSGYLWLRYDRVLNWADGSRIVRITVNGTLVSWLDVDAFIIIRVALLLALRLVLPLDLL